MDKLKKLLDYVIEQEKKYYDFAGSALDKNNMVESMLYSAEATAFQRVRYAIEDLMNDERR